jgi:hypothetical protein
LMMDKVKSNFIIFFLIFSISVILRNLALNIEASYLGEFLVSLK